MSYVFLASLLTGAVGTFVGAVSAFALERESRLEDKKDEQAAQGNLAILTLSQFYNYYVSYKKDVIDNIPKGKPAWVTMKVTFRFVGKEPGFEPKKLQFLFEGNNNQVLPNLLQEEGNFRTWIGMLNDRHDLMSDKIHPKFAERGIDGPDTPNEVTLREIIGPDLYNKAHSLTSHIIHYDEYNIDSIRRTYKDLRDLLVSMFPEREFIRIEFEAEQDPQAEQGVTNDKTNIPNRDE